MSPRIQMPNKMHRKVDYAVYNGTEVFVEDSYDILYE